eukprot:1077625-Amphidinium_carterae.3
MRTGTTSRTMTSIRRTWSTELEAMITRIYLSMETTTCTTKRNKPDKKQENQRNTTTPQTITTGSERTVRTQCDASTIQRLDVCEICVKGKNRQQYLRKEGLNEQGITQIDYTFIRGDNDHYKATVFTMCKAKPPVLEKLQLYGGKAQQPVQYKQ